MKKAMTKLMVLGACMLALPGFAQTEGAIETDVFQTKSGKKVFLYSIKHACLRLVVDGLEIEIDPVSKLGARETDYTTFPKADFILVTHEHGDHLDPGAIQDLWGEKTVLVTNQRCADQLGKGQVMKNGDKTALKKWLQIEAVPAYNTTPGREKFHPKGRDNGYVLTIDGLRLYIAGDTEDIPEMKKLGHIDVALLPCNQPYTMTTDQLVKAARMVKPRILIPYHYGKTDLSGVPEQLKGDGIDVRIRQLQ